MKNSHENSPESFSIRPVKDTHFQSQIQEIPPLLNELIRPDETLIHIENSKKELDLVLLRMAAEAEIDLSKPLMPPQMGPTISGETVLSQGDISLTTGKAKSRKTFLNTLLIAVSDGNLSIGNIKAFLPPDQNVGMCIDTEQGKYHTRQSTKRIHQLIKDKSPPNFKAYDEITNVTL